MSKIISSRLTLVALVIAAATVIARATMLESLREPFGPQSRLSMRGAGPAVGLCLDLLCCIPALLVLLRDLIDPGQQRSRSWACMISALLALWTAASFFWADDRFSALVSAAHLIAAFALLWAMSRLVTTWPPLRLITAVAYGLLLLYLTQAILWRYVDMPQTLAGFEANKTEYLKELGWKANDFSARQFEQKLRNAELLGFNASANSFAAALVLLLGVSGGLVIQRLIAGEYEWAALIAVPIPIAFWILSLTQSKAALVTPVLIAAMLLLAWRFPAPSHRQSRRAYVAGVIIVLLGAATIVIYGLVYHRLPSASLNFRWRYWTAAWRMLLDRPLLGVGWENFGAHYLRYRLPQAAEEIQDPHDFILRFLTELGIAGGFLAIGWIARLAWELTQPVLPGPSSNNRSGMGLIALVAASGLLINFLSSVDFTQSLDTIGMELLRRMLFLCVLVLGATVAGIRSVRDQILDDRPAPWILYSVIAALAAFLIHNLIEFSIFEPGPLMIFAMLAGSALGMRSQPIKRSSPLLSASCLGLGGLAWLAAAIVLVIPIGQAETLAHDGDDNLRNDQFNDAVDDYLQAAAHVPFNADYLYRAALAMDSQPQRDPGAINDLLNRAIQRNPSGLSYYLFQARFAAQLNDAPAANADFAKALELNPNEVSIRLDYADALMHLKLPADAAAQYELALKYNDLLPMEEPKRINDGAIRGRYATALLNMGKRQEALVQCQRALLDNDSFPLGDPRRLSDAEVTAVRALADKLR